MHKLCSVSSHTVPICPVNNPAFSDVTQALRLALLTWSYCCKVSVLCRASPPRYREEEGEGKKSKRHMP